MPDAAIDESQQLGMAIRVIEYPKIYPLKDNGKARLGFSKGVP